MSKNLDLKITGNPFIDAGIFALKGMLDKSINNITIEDIENEAKFISKLYLNDAWNKNMHSIFPNSSLDQALLSATQTIKAFALLTCGWLKESFDKSSLASFSFF